MKNEGRWLKGRTVLVVEDHDDTRDALRQMIESFGVTVRLARDGYEGLERVGETPPDLILCDLRMPRMDGFTFLARLRDDPGLPHIRVVAVTGLGTDADIMRTWGAGFDGHLIKPIDYDVIAAQLKRAFRTGRRG